MFISVVLPAYNAERFAAEAIDSVLAQTHTDFELILIDDGSTDSTLDILRSYAARDCRIKVLAHENLGVARAMNQAMSVAQSNWIARMDADDIMEPRRLERQVAFVAEHPDLAVTSCLVTYIDAGGRTLGRSAPEFTSDEEVRKTRDAGTPIGFHHPGVLMRRDVVVGIGGYRSEFVSAQDMDLWNRIADAGGRILVQPEYLLRYRI
ncbi:MAG TPA: glycosyltransferase, partial [Thermomicrobiales bacterium]|nr:glycosyltransferase [Thermomicrobiales bacterium]